jgi:hypothetical protein
MLSMMIFVQQQHQSLLRNGPMGNIAGMEQTRSLVQTLSQNQDPKFQVLVRLHNRWHPL